MTSCPQKVIGPSKVDLNRSRNPNQETQMPSLLPRNDSELAIWLTNYSKQLAVVGPTVGLADADVTAEQKRCAAMIVAIQTDDQKRKDWRAAAEATRRLKQQELPAMRATMARMRTHTSWTPALAQSLGAVATTASSGPLEAYKPMIRAQTQAGRVEIKFTRRWVDGVNVYTRKRGEGAWRLLGRFTQSPCVDPTPAPAAAPEAREYRVIGVVKDREIGQVSDIVVVTMGE